MRDIVQAGLGLPGVTTGTLGVPVPRGTDRSGVAPRRLTPKLLTPGPMALPINVKMPMLTDLASRGEEIIRMTSDVRRMLSEMAGGAGSHEAVLLQGSGTFAIEAAIGTFCGPQSRVLVVVNGIYGERAMRILRCHGVPCEAITFAANERPDVDAVARRLESRGDFSHLVFVHCETTTGILNPLAELSALARRHRLISMVDAMSSFGGAPIDLRETPVDVLVGSGNKCVEAPPGIAFAVVKRALLERAHGNSLSYSLDLHDQWRAMDQTGEWRCTPPTHVLQALHAALAELWVEGIGARRRRFERIRDRVIAGLEPLGFVPVVAPQHRASVCVAFTCPAWAGREAAAFEAFTSALNAANLHIYAKMHGPTASFRIGCIGAIEDAWIDALIATATRHMRHGACLEGVATR